MGYKVRCLMMPNLRSAVYIASLRSRPDVHPTLRAVAQKIGRWLDDHFGCITHANYGADQWSLSRGTQDIVEKA